jgi:membrane associated rhomboid family serine protease
MCAHHPDRAASVVCARCDRPICTDCMLHAPVGWQCPACVRGATSTSQRVRFARPGTRTGSIGSTNPTPVVIGLVVINVICYAASGFGRTSVIDSLGLWPAKVHFLHQDYRLVTSMFLHLNFLHIAFNMITLLIVGPAVEVMLGRARFAALYLLAGLGGGVVMYLIGPTNEVSVGASGAIFGVMGAYVVLARRERRPVAQVVVLIVVNLVIGFSGNIAWQAHVGGLISGGILGLAYHQTTAARRQPDRVLWALGSSALALAVLALLLFGVAPGHVNLT